MARTAALSLALIALLSSAPAAAQTLGIEAGIASVENFDPVEAAYGISLFAPLTDRVTGSIGYTQWTGSDGNADLGATDARLYGNRAVNAVALVRLFGRRGFSGSVGAGVGLYERERIGEDDAWDGALTLSAMLEQPLSSFVGVYGRADVSAPWDGGGPAWGLFRVGVQARLF